MAHASYADLADLEPILDAVRTWELVKEPKPGTFYLKGKGFLHFHVKGDRRWADARSGADWGSELDIPADASAAARTRFEKELKRRHRATLDALRPETKQRKK